MIPNNKSTKRKSWTAIENETLGRVVVESVNSGSTFTQAYVKVSEQLDRTPYAIEQQWRTVVKPHFVDQINKSSNKVEAKNETPNEEVTQDTASSVVENILSGIQEAAKNDAQSLFNLFTNIKPEKDVMQTIIQSLGSTPFDLFKMASNTFTELESSLKAEEEKSAQTQKPAYEGREKAAPKDGTTRLAALRKSIETFESENFKIMNSGKDGLEYVVINNEEDKAYLVKVDAEKVVECNCPHHQFRKIDGKGVICKHMLKVAMDKNLEVF